MAAFVTVPVASHTASEAHAADTVRKSKKTGIDFQISPGDVEIHLDGKKIGTAADVSFRATKPGTHNVRLVRGGDEFEVELPVKRGQVVSFAYDFE